MDSQFWRGRKVFLTGHTGFKGSWLTLWLHELGARVTGFSLAPHTEPNLYSLARLDDRVDSVIADVRDRHAVAAAIRDARPEVVIHMAAQALVRPSYAEPLETYATNVMGTAHVLDAIRHIGGVKAAVVVTSDKCYDNREWPWGYRENDAMGGYDPYSSSKGCAELVTASYRNAFFSPVKLQSHGVAVASARAGNVIGGGDWAQDRLLPDIIRALLEQRHPVIRNPQAIRPWQHVLEPLSGYLILAERLFREGAKFCEAWNFGPFDTDAKAVSWIATRAAKAWGGAARWISDPGEHAHEARHLRLDSSKARHLLGWSSRWNVQQAIEATVQWHKRVAAGEDPRAVTLEQIAAYGATSAMADTDTTTESRA
jgi:CDP-glucose 4,6-dehydratase